MTGVRFTLRRKSRFDVPALSGSVEQHLAVSRDISRQLVSTGTHDDPVGLEAIELFHTGSRV
jgi:hypothetical protein